MRSATLLTAALAAVALLPACLDASSGASGLPAPDTSSGADADAAPSKETDAAPSADTAEADEGPDVPRAECVATGASCEGGEPCCTGFCSGTLQVYAPAVCTDPLPDGAFCLDAAHCASGGCIDGVCAAPNACTPTGGECWSDEKCCTGSCTFDAGRNDVGVCVLDSPQCVANGGACAVAAECCSGACEGGQCQAAGPSCDAQPAECWSSFDCCEGTFCSYAGFDYTPGKCLEAQPDGAWCAADAWCASGQCVDGTCGKSECNDAGEACWAAAECCSGLCSFSGGVYAPGTCFKPQAVGASCSVDAACQSGSCVDGACAAKKDAVTFARVWDEVLVPKGCTGGYCHGAPGGALDLSNQQMAYYSLTSSAAATPACGAFLRVVPGHPDQSVLWLRVRPLGLEPGAEPCLPKMPHGSDGLDATSAALVKAWIEHGALP